MKRVISARDVEEFLQKDGHVDGLPSDAILTPSARDKIRDWQGPGGRSAPAPARKPAAAAPRAGGGGNDPEAFFSSPENQALKEEICDIGRRLWHRAYVDGNGGNISVRVGENLAICTPTLVSKGFMKPEDMCLVEHRSDREYHAHHRRPSVARHTGPGA